MIDYKAFAVKLTILTRFISLHDLIKTSRFKDCITRYQNNHEVKEE